ncbi:MAG: hypothetical protein AB7I12_14790 [Steroidobacteraceae bacterium]
MCGKIVNAIRIIFGIHMALSGLNWWVKITLYPSIVDFIDKPPPHDVLGALVATGFMFHIVKATELFCGLALLFNVYVPLVLVLVLLMPITVSAFLTDVFVDNHLRGMVVGISAMLNNTFLLFSYFSRYRSMMSVRVKPDPW